MTPLGTRTGAALAAIALALALLSALGGPYVVYLANLTAIYAIAALGLNLLTGFCGLVSLGHNAFFAIGAYTSAVLTAKVSVPFVAAAPAAALLTMLVSVLVGLPALRLTGIYLAMATLAVAFMVEEVVLQASAVTNGANGLAAAKPAIGTFVFQSDAQFVYLVWPLAAACFWLARNMAAGRTGRAWLAIRGNELAADALGVSLTRYKLIAFSVSGLFTGLSGALFAHYVGFIAPENFTWFLSVQFLTMIVIGGIGSLWGSLLGPAFFVVLPELLRGAQDHQLGVFGALLVGVMILVPRGLVGVLDAIEARFRPRRGALVPEG